MSDTDHSETEVKQPDKGEAPTSAGSGEEERPGGGAVPFADKFDIRSDKRLPHMDVGPVKAYETVGKAKYTGNYVALICEYHLVPRIASSQVFADFINPALVKLVHHGVVDWLPGKGQRYAFVYEQIRGRPLIQRGGRQALGFKADTVLGAVVKQIVPVLQNFRDKDFVHGNIRADNVFSAGGDKIENIVLGECLSTPNSSMQPCAYLPVERAMADPEARGGGSRADDMYAFGVLLAVLLRHSDPLEGSDDRTIIRQKIEVGSFMALTGKDRLTGPVIELLRGLLHDDPSQRWSLEEVEAWLDGQRLSPKQLIKKNIAARPLNFNGARYLRPGILAMELHDNLHEAVDLVENGTMEQWLERSLEMKGADEALEVAIRAAAESGHGSAYKENLGSRLSVILDPEAPLRIANLNMHPEGVGTSLVQAFLLKKDLQPYAEIIRSQIVLFWLEFNRTSNVDAGALVSRFESCRAFVRQKNIGYGLERSVYVLCPESPCLSEKLRNYYVRTPEDLMYALEDMCEGGNAPVMFLDRHIVAFLSVKDRNNVDPYLMDINADTKHQQILSHLNTLATIQSRSRMEKFPAITRTFAAMLAPVYEIFHDRDLRESLKKRIDGLKDSGDLGKMKSVLDSEELYRKDYRAFRNAMIEYNSLQKEQGKLEQSTENEGDFGKSTGHQIAAVVSALLGGAAIMISALLTFSG